MAFQVPNNSLVPPPYYPNGEVQIGHLSQHAKMTPVPAGSSWGGRPAHPRWLPAFKPPEPWRDPDRTPDFLGLSEPYRASNEDPGDGGRLGGEYVYEKVEGVMPGEAKLKANGTCNLF
jgi:hypothetical protein